MDQGEYERRVKALLNAKIAAGGAFDPEQGREYNLEDRRNEGAPLLDSARLLDPTPLASSLRPRYLPPGEYYANQLEPGDQNSPLAKQLGINDIERSHNLDILKLLGFGGS
jgi:hypothetical protein